MRPRASRPALATATVFAVSGAAFGTWVARIPAIRDALDASNPALGLALVGPGLGSLATMPFVGVFTRRWGAAGVVMISGLPACLALALLPYVPSVTVLGLVLLGWGAAYGAWDVAMNVHAVEVDRRAGRPWMPRYHGAWSVGGLLGAGLGGLAAAAGISVTVHFSVAALVLAALVAGATRMFLETRGESAAPQGNRPAERHPTPRLLDRRLVLLGLVTLAGTCVEGAAADWLALYLADVRETGPGLAAMGYTVFAAAMALTRFAGTGIVERLGRVSAVRLAGLAVAVGIAVTLGVPGLGGAFAGAAIWGAGVALVFPAAMSAAGDTRDREDDAIAAVSTIGYGGFLLGPPMVGFLAAGVGLGTALWSLLVLAALIVALAPAGREQTAFDDFPVSAGVRNRLP